MATSTPTGSAESAERFSVLGTRPIRPDGVDKVIGRALFGADIKLPGLVYGAVLRSPHAHARILKIDPSRAEAMVGVLAVMTGDDMPTTKSEALELGEEVTDVKFSSERVMARAKAIYKGHPVAAVAAVDINTAQEALKLIEVEYEPLRPMISLQDAMAADAEIIHDDLLGTHLGEKVPHTNIAAHNRTEFGDPDAAFASSATVIERTYTISRAHQGYIEPQAATAIWDQDDRITVWTTSQGSFPIRTNLALVLLKPPSSIRVVPTEVGGGFGGKNNIYLEPLAAILSRKCGKPVKMVMERKAVFEATGPGPGGQVTMKMGVDENGVITAAAADIRYGAGAYPGSSIGAATTCILASYKIPNVRIDAYDVVTNMSKTAAYRAPGSPQATFATESLVSELCEQIGMSSIDFHLLNAVEEGDRRADGPVYPRIGLKQVLQTLKDSEHYNSKLDPVGPDGKLRGRGMASGFWAGIGNRSSVNMSVNNDGAVAILEGNADLNGSRVSLGMQAAEALGIAASDVNVSIGDTDSVGFNDITAGSRTTFATGAAIIKAAGLIADELKTRAAALWETDADSVEFADGAFTNKKAPEQRLTFKEAAAKLERADEAIAVTGTVNMRGSGGGSFACHLVDMEVDPDTGKASILRYTAVQDAGKAVHPAYVEGQMQGGAAQGVGWALNEEYYTSPDGVMQNSSFLDYRMPTALDLPMIETIIVEVPNSNHPFGVRGIGETGIVPPAPAIANAIHDAIGMRMYQTPMNPGRILKALKDKRDAAS
jgi:xanthine dehydrogenase molybdenum-binding subunit